MGIRATLTSGHEKSAMDTLVHRFTLILTSCTQCLHAETAALIHVVRLLVGKVTKASADIKIFTNLICTYFQNLSNEGYWGEPNAYYYSVSYQHEKKSDYGSNIV